jgi:predicted dehydrogenase
MKFLIIGFGSIGKRHAVNLAELGVNISVVEPNQVKMNQAIQLGFKVYKSLEEFESKVDYEITAVIICTPPVLHIHHTKWAVNQNKKVFLEKPIGMNYEECSSLVSDSFKNLFVGYSYRWNPQRQDW